MKKIIITGCEGQLGRVFVDHLVAMGNIIIGIDVAPSTDNPLLDHYSQVDITDSNSIDHFFKNYDDSVDVLINNAGVSVFTPFEERTVDEIAYVLDVNVKGTILMTQNVFTRHFKAKKQGCIVNIGSIYGVCAGDMRLYNEGDRRTPEIYGASKAAVINLTKYFSAYMAPYHVRVNCLSPGGIQHTQDNEFVKKYANKVPMTRMGEAKELLSTIDYLIDGDSSYLTGQNIIIDGGFTVW